MNSQEYRNLSEAYLDVYQEEVLDELHRGRHGQTETEYMDSRSDAGKQISGDSKTSGAAYSHRSYKGVGKPAKPGERQETQGKMDTNTRTDILYRKAARLKKEELSLDERVLGQDPEMRRARTKDEKRLPPSSGKEYAANQKKSISYMDKLTKNNKIIPGMAHESYDLFDYIMEYLITEGYADTNENALVIMANMSEDWRDSIVEGYQEPRFGRKDYLKKLSKRGGMGMGTPEDPHGYRDPKMAKVGAEFSKRKSAAMKAKKSGEPDTYRAEKEAQSKNR